MQVHGSKNLALTGRPLALVYRLITSLMSTPIPATVVIIDLTQRFSPSHLLPSLPISELKHIHVFRPTKANFSLTLDGVEDYMVFGNHGSRYREWRGTFILGGSAPTEKGLGEERLLVSTGWKGWLRVEREEVVGFGLGLSVEDAWGEREQRWSDVQSKGWKAVCEEGVFVFQ
jgi:hypothetical protein